MKKPQHEIFYPSILFLGRPTVGQYRAELESLVKAGRITEYQAECRLRQAIDLEFVNFADRRLSSEQAFDFFGNALGQQPAALAAPPRRA